MTVTVYIPTSCVGAVIGRRGSTIAMIQKQAQTPNAPPVRVSIVGHGQSSTTTGPTTGSGDAKVDVASASSLAVVESPKMDPTQDPATTPTSVPFTYTSLDFSDPQWTPVVIRADPLAAWTVAQKLQSLCTSIQDVIFDLPIGRQRHASIVGKRGLTLQQLSASATCRIWVPPKELKLDVVQLEAPLENCGLGLQALGELLAEPKKSKTFQLQLTVPQLPSQTKLRGVGRKTDTIIKKKKTDDNLWVLTILGSIQSQVQTAHAMLSKWSEDGPSSSNSGTTPPSTPPTTKATTSIEGGPSSPPPQPSPRGAKGGGNGGAGGGGGGRVGGGGGRGGPMGRGGRGRKGKPRPTTPKGTTGTHNNNTNTGATE